MHASVGVGVTKIKIADVHGSKYAAVFVNIIVSRQLSTQNGMIEGSSALCETKTHYFVIVSTLQFPFRPIRSNITVLFEV